MSVGSAVAPVIKGQPAKGLTMGLLATMPELGVKDRVYLSSYLGEIRPRNAI